MKKKCRAKVMAEVLGSLLVGVTIPIMTLACAPALAELSNYNPQGLQATTLEEILALPDEEIDLATAILILSKEWDATVNIKESLEEINRMALEVRVLMNTEDDPEIVVSLINHYLFEKMNYAYVDDSSGSDLTVLEAKVLPQVIKNKEGDCLGLSLLYLAVTERLELPFYGVALLDHFFIRYDDGQKKINIETTLKGEEHGDSYYEKECKIYPNHRKNNFYLRNLSKKEVIGVFLCGVGTVYTDKGMYGEAIVEFKKAIEINPNHPEAHYNLGTTYGEKGILNEAIVEFKKAIEINPNHPDAHNNLGTAYYHKGMYDEAIVEYRKAIEINPNHPGAHYNLGTAYRKKGMYDEAIDKFKKALEINPNLAMAHNNLAVAYYYYKGEYSLAIKHCDKAIELGSSVDPTFLELLEPYREK